MHLKYRAIGFLVSHPTLLLIERPTQLYRYLRSPIYRRWFWSNVNEANRLADAMSPDEMQAEMETLSERAKRDPLVPWIG